MEIKYTSRIGYVLLFMLVFSCAEILEENIEDELPVLLSPAAGYLEYGTFTFWWTEVKGATQYQLQIITPTFDRPERLYLDTLVSTAAFDFTPVAGSYQWRVKALNSAYETAFTEPRDLNVLDGDDLSRVKVILQQPANGSATNETDVEFSWLEIPIATAYRFELHSGTSVVVDDTVDIPAFTHTFSEEDKSFQWQVTAFNATSKSVSEAVTFDLDFTSPSAPELSVPKEDSLIDFSSKLTLRWVRKSTDVIFDSIHIYDENGDEVEGFIPATVTEPALEIDNSKDIFKKDQTYLWRVISFDKAGNESDPSERKFKVKVQ
jgi:hypothetical protein